MGIWDGQASSYGYMRTVHGPSVHCAPGLSLGYTEPLPPQAMLYRDGEPAGVITEDVPEAGPPAFLRHLPTRLPYEVAVVNRVYLFGLGGGLGILEARAGGARHMVVAEPDPNAQPNPGNEHTARSASAPNEPIPKASAPRAIVIP